jgi:hypothetical protein
MSLFASVSLFGFFDAKVPLSLRMTAVTASFGKQCIDMQDVRTRNAVDCSQVQEKRRVQDWHGNC